MSASALAIKAGVKAAEIAALKRDVVAMKAKVDGLEKRIRASRAAIKRSFASFGLNLPDDFGDAEIEAGKTFIESYNVRTQQIADQQVASLGFTPKSELDAAMQSCFQK
jgi:hypothetical protein